MTIYTKIVPKISGVKTRSSGVKTRSSGVKTRRPRFELTFACNFMTAAASTLCIIGGLKPTVPATSMGREPGRTHSAATLYRGQSYMEKTAPDGQVKAEPRSLQDQIKDPRPPNL